jgi:hypothetical protein
MCARFRFNVVRPGALGAADPAYPLPAQFVSVLFPVGHVKSTVARDTHFVHMFSASEKWLRVTE